MTLFLIAAEPSADLHGASLIQKLLAKKPDLKIFAIAGPEMRKFPIEVIEPMESFCVMGFVDVIKALPRLCALFWKIKKEILQLNPSTVITIDYPGFNLRLQKALKKSGFLGKCVHYICPTVWAWGKNRIFKMEKSLDLLLTILPFEPKCFEKTSLQVEYVGHPLISKIKKQESKRENILALFPGSRKKEVQRNLPLQLAVAKILKKLDPTLKIAISSLSSNLLEGFSNELKDIEIYPFSQRYELMQKTKLALAKSGTVTLELGLHGTPTIVQYAIDPFDQFLATKIFKINLPYYSLPNLLMNEELFPELIGSNLNLDTLLKNAHELWFDEEKLYSMRKKTELLREILQEMDASEVASSYLLR